MHIEIIISENDTFRKKCRIFADESNIKRKVFMKFGFRKLSIKRSIPADAVGTGTFRE